VLRNIVVSPSHLPYDISWLSSANKNFVNRQVVVLPPVRKSPTPNSETASALRLFVGTLLKRSKQMQLKAIPEKQTQANKVLPADTAWEARRIQLLASTDCGYCAMVWSFSFSRSEFSSSLLSRQRAYGHWWQTVQLCRGYIRFWVHVGHPL
jgi:hypothetical protein